MVSNHYSLCSARGNGDLFQEVFPGSGKANIFVLSAEQLNHIILHGLATCLKIRITKLQNLRHVLMNILIKFHALNRRMFVLFVTKKKQSKLKIFIEDLRSCVQAFIQSLLSAAIILAKIQFFYSLLSSLSP